MENRGYSIYEVGILGGNDKVKTNLFVLFVLLKYDTNKLSKRTKDRCCNFRLLEEKCKEYEKEEVAI